MELIPFTNWQPVTTPFLCILISSAVIMTNRIVSCRSNVNCGVNDNKYDDVATSGFTKCLRLQHYICWSELPVPRIAVTFSLQEVEEIEKDCAVYRGRLERIAKHCAISREEQVHRHMCIVPTCDMCKCL